MHDSKCLTLSEKMFSMPKGLPAVEPKRRIRIAAISSILMR